MNIKHSHYNYNCVKLTSRNVFVRLFVLVLVLLLTVVGGIDDFGDFSSVK